VFLFLFQRFPQCRTLAVEWDQILGRNAFVVSAFLIYIHGTLYMKDMLFDNTITSSGVC
jgi:hypothetical protein